MRITRRQIRRLIREALVVESREAHMQGIRDKLGRLDIALDQHTVGMEKIDDEAQRMEAEFPSDPYAGREMIAKYGDPLRDQIEGIRNKIDLLNQQLDALEGADGGPVGPMPRNDGSYWT